MSLFSIGTAVTHTLYGQGVVVDYHKTGHVPLVQFKKSNSILHDGSWVTASGKRFKFRHCWYCWNEEEIQLIEEKTHGSYITHSV